jgi:hypothetical protein
MMKIISTVLAILLATSAMAQDFEITQRPGVTAFPVPAIQPLGPSNCVDPVTGTAGRCPTAVDIAPHGATNPLGNHGYAWMDVCDVDILGIDRGQIANNGFNCARVGINSTAIWLGSIVYGAASQKSVDLVHNGVAKLRLTASGAQSLDDFSVGTTNLSPGVSNNDTGVSITPDGTIYASRSGFPALILNRTSGGVIAQFRVNGAQVGTITATGSGIVVAGFEQIDGLNRKYAEQSKEIEDLKARVAALENPSRQLTVGDLVSSASQFVSSAWAGE